MTISISALRDEGILEIGAATESGSLLFVRTKKRLVITHLSWLPRRELDAYAIDVAACLIDSGETMVNVAREFSLRTPELHRELKRAGYAYFQPRQPRTSKEATL